MALGNAGLPRRPEPAQGETSSRGSEAIKREANAPAISILVSMHDFACTFITHMLISLWVPCLEAVIHGSPLQRRKIGGALLCRRPFFGCGLSSEASRDGGRRCGARS